MRLLVPLLRPRTTPPVRAGSSRPSVRPSKGAQLRTIVARPAMKTTRPIGPVNVTGFTARNATKGNAFRRHTAFDLARVAFGSGRPSSILVRQRSNLYRDAGVLRRPDVRTGASG